MKRLYHLDLLRVISTIAVVFLHVGAFYCYKYNIIPVFSWLFANFIDSLMRFSVPIFIMISGFFLLSDDKSLNLKKRLPKILIPLIFASIIYIAWFKYNNANYDVFKGLFAILKGPIVYHLWFPYALAGLYILTPLLKFFIKDKKATEYFLILWLIFSVTLPLIAKFTRFSFGINLDFLQGYIGIYVLGYYLNNGRIQIKNCKILTSIFLLGFISTFIGVWMLTKNGNGVLDEYFYTLVSPTVILMYGSIFLLFKNLFQHKEGNHFVSNLSKISYGVYLYHVLFIALIELAFATSINNDVSIPLIITIKASAVIIVSYLFSFALSKIKIIKYLSLGI